MQLEVLQENLTKTIAVAVRFTSSQANLPILSNLLLKAEKSAFEVLATNLESSIQIRVGAKIEKEGTVLLGARTLIEYLNTIEPQKLNLSLEEQKLKISGEKAQALFVIARPEEFPRFPELKKDSLGSFPKEGLKRLIQQTAFAAATDETRPVLTGILIKKSQNRTTLVATDGFRLSEASLATTERKNTTEETKEFQLIVRASALRELERLLTDTTFEEVVIFLTQEENQIAFKVGDAILMTRLLEAEYPAYEKIIPESFNLEVLVESEEFQRAIKTVSIFAGRETQTVKLKLNPATNQIVLNAQSASLGESESIVLGEIKGEGFEMAFNARFLLEGVNSFKKGQIKVQIKEAVAPTLFTAPGDETYCHVIMPIRLETKA